MSDVKEQPDGTVKLVSSKGDVRSFTPNGKYENYSPFQNGYRAGDPTMTKSSYDMLDQTTVPDREVLGPTGKFACDGNDKLTSMQSLQGTGDSHVSAQLTYNPDGSIQTARLADATQDVRLESTGSNSWKASVGDDVYSWKGHVYVNGANSDAPSIQIKPQDGKPASFSLSSGGSDVANTLSSTGEYQSIENGKGYVRADSQGNVFLKSARYINASINGEPVGSVEKAITPGDTGKIKMDVGDRAPEIETYNITMGKAADGNVTVNGQELTPGGKQVSLYNLVKNSKPISST
jgi:hypothetical protein